jgi:hypothetical protein
MGPARFHCATLLPLFRTVYILVFVTELTKERAIAKGRIIIIICNGKNTVFSYV